MLNALDALWERAAEDVEHGWIPSCQMAIAHDGKVIASRTVGAATPESRYVIWSCTKALTAGALWMLIADGLLDVERRVVDYIPEFGTNGKDVVTIDHLLLFTAGLPWSTVRPKQWPTSAGRCEAFSKWRLRWEPGTRFQYHQFSAHWVFAELIFRLTGRDHRDFVGERVIGPLGLRDLRLGVPPEEQGDIVDMVLYGRKATPEELDAAGVSRPDPEEPVAPDEGMLFVNDPRARAAGIPGGGAVSTAADVALYYQALLHNPGRMWDPDVLHDGTQVVRNTFGDPAKAGTPVNRTRGLVVAGGDGLSHLRMNFGRMVSPRTFGHDGAAGQIAWADPETGISFCYLTNGEDLSAVHKSRRADDISGLAAQVRP